MADELTDEEVFAPTKELTDDEVFNQSVTAPVAPEQPPSAMSPAEEKGAVVQAAQDHPVLENAAGAVADIVQGIPTMATQAAKGVVDAMKFQVGTPQQQAQAVADLAGQATGQGKQLASDVQSPLGSRESFRGLAQLGMMAAPALGLKEVLFGEKAPPVQGSPASLTDVLFPKQESPPIQELTAATEKEVPNASQITIPESTTQPEVRPPVGESAPLRQQGETPEARQGTEAQPAQEVAPTEIPPSGELPPSTPEAPPVQGELPADFEPPNPVKGSGKFRKTYQVDKELGDMMEGIGAAKESGSLMGQYAGDKILEALNPAQEADLGKYLVSRRLQTLNPEHSQVLSPEESARIESDPAIAKALDTYRNEVKPQVEELRKQAGLSEAAAAGKEPEFISLINKPVPEGTGSKVSQASKLPRTTRFAKKAEGQGQEYDTNLRAILEQSYSEVNRKARVSEFYKAAERKGLVAPTEGNAKVQFEDLPPELQHDLRAATERELQPSGISTVLQKVQRATTGAALTANPPEIVNHMRRQLDIVSAVPPVGRGLVSRLEAIVPYIGTRTGTFARTISDNMSKAENRQILQDIFDAGGGSSRSFKHLYESKIPGIKQLQNFTHDMLFGIPRGKGIQGWDLRMRVQLEKIRRSAEGNTDPQRIREFANQIGQYGSHPDWFVRGLRTINPYAATTIPIRLTELKQAVGTSGLKSDSIGASLGKRAETLLRGTGGTLLGLATANKLMSGQWPWENDKGHEFDLNTGTKSDDGKALYIKFRAVAPTLSRPLNTSGIPNLRRESTAEKPDYLAAFETSLANAGLSLIQGPAQNALLTALTGKAPYITKGPGKRPEVMDIAKTEKGGNRGLEQLKHAAAGINPVGGNFVEEPYAPKVEGPLKYIEKPLPGVRPFGAIFTQAYEKADKPKADRRLSR